MTPNEAERTTEETKENIPTVESATSRYNEALYDEFTSNPSWESFRVVLNTRLVLESAKEMLEGTYNSVATDRDQKYFERAIDRVLTKKASEGEQKVLYKVLEEIENSMPYTPNFEKTKLGLKVLERDLNKIEKGTFLEHYDSAELTSYPGAPRNYVDHGAAYGLEGQRENEPSWWFRERIFRELMSMGKTIEAGEVLSNQRRGYYERAVMLTVLGVKEDDLHIASSAEQAEAEFQRACARAMGLSKWRKLTNRIQPPPKGTVRLTYAEF